MGRQAGEKERNGEKPLCIGTWVLRAALGLSLLFFLLFFLSPNSPPRTPPFAPLCARPRQYHHHYPVSPGRVGSRKSHVPLEGNASCIRLRLSAWARADTTLHAIPAQDQMTRS
jgi:hypothetical protein